MNVAARLESAVSPLTLGWIGGLRYGLLGMPLAFVALPLYVALPAHYAASFGMSLATLGAVLLATRAFDAVLDPLIGRWVDRLFARSAAAAWRMAALGAAAVAVGFQALFFPALRSPGGLLAWLAVALAITYLGYSVVSIVHQAWGARLGGTPALRANVVAWREAAALIGVLLASVLPSVAGFGAAAGALVALLACGIALLRVAPQPSLPAAPDLCAAPAPQAPWRATGFSTLMAVFVVNGIASAIPATLVLFFIRDQLQAGKLEPLFLASYFALAALSVPFWVRLVARAGLVRAWLAGMLLAVAAFAWTPWLGAGDTLAFLCVCAASGVALGADLIVPGALLAGIVQRAGRGRPAPGAYFGWWNAASKLNLALAAGAALPLLGWAGYAPGARDTSALRALALVYAGLPCLLKLAAAWLLWRRQHLLGEAP